MFLLFLSILIVPLVSLDFDLLHQFSSTFLSYASNCSDNLGLSTNTEKNHPNNSANWIYTVLQYRNFTTEAKRIISTPPFNEFQALRLDDLSPSPGEVDLYLHMPASMFLFVNIVPVLNIKTTHLPLNISLLQFHWDNFLAKRNSSSKHRWSIYYKIPLSENWNIMVSESTEKDSTMYLKREVTNMYLNSKTAWSQTADTDSRNTTIEVTITATGTAKFPGLHPSSDTSTQDLKATNEQTNSFISELSRKTNVTLKVFFIQNNIWVPRYCLSWTKLYKPHGLLKDQVYRHLWQADPCQKQL